MATPLDRSRRLLEEYGAADACPADILCDRHDPDAVAFTIVDADLSAVDITYGRLRTASAGFAAGLAELGVGPGDRVATLMGKSLELVVAQLAIWRLGAVYVPLFTAFAAPAVAARLADSAAKVVVCDADQRPKLGPPPEPADRPWRIVTAGAADALADSGIDYATVASGGARPVEPFAGGGRTPLVLVHTSGTTGRPKGVLIPLTALATWQVYLEYGLYVTPDDVYWCAADPGWTYGLYAGIIAPLAAGRRSLLVRPRFDPALTWSVLDRHRVTNVTAAPTVYRSLRTSRRPQAGGLALRRASSAGEPLTAEVNAWAPTALGVPVHDHYGQTELGMLVSNHHHPDLAGPLRPGSMGRVAPGWSAAVLHEERDEEVPPGTFGRIAVDLHASPLAWFTGYDGDPDASARKFSADRRWYFTGDTGSRDEDGHFHFSARDDDVIIMAGYRIGPFDVESVLATHPAVAECAVVAVPDEVRGEVIEAFVVTSDGGSGGPELAALLQD